MIVAVVALLKLASNLTDAMTGVLVNPAAARVIRSKAEELVDADGEVTSLSRGPSAS